jgi:hypothetical protein
VSLSLAVSVFRPRLHQGAFPLQIDLLWMRMPAPTEWMLALTEWMLALTEWMLALTEWMLALTKWMLALMFDHTKFGDTF